MRTPTYLVCEAFRSFPGLVDRWRFVFVSGRDALSRGWSAQSSTAVVLSCMIPLLERASGATKYSHREAAPSGGERKKSIEKDDQK